MGGYWAATIRYRMGVFSPTGQPVDSLTLTGYGNSFDDGGAEDVAGSCHAVAAMRDASAKFLVQLPRQPIAARLAAGQVIDVPTAPHADGRCHRGSAHRSPAARFDPLRSRLSLTLGRFTYTCSLNTSSVR